MKLGKILLGALLVSGLVSASAKADFTLFEIQSGNTTGVGPFFNGANDSFAKTVFAGVTVANPPSANQASSAGPNSDGPLQRGAGLIHSGSAEDTYTVQNFDQSSLANAISNNDFVTLTFSMDAVRNLTGISLAFNDLPSGGSGSAVIQFSSNGGTSYQDAATVSGTGGGTTTLTADLTQLTNTQGISSGVFRFVFFSPNSSNTVEFVNSLAIVNPGDTTNTTVRVIAVPEPSSIALLSLAGVGAVGVVAYRRKKAKKAE